MDHLTDTKLALLRVQLFTAAQSLRGAHAEEFWQLLEDVLSLRPSADGAAGG